jgi:hypothetical protein
MGYSLLQNQTSRALIFRLRSSTDSVTPLAGVTPTVAFSKNGAAFAAPAGALTEIGVGFWKVAGNATDQNTLGPLILNATVSGGNTTEEVFEVVAYNPDVATNLGLSGIPAATPGANGGLPTCDASNNVRANLVAVLATALTETTGGNLAAAVKKLFDVATPVLTAASVNQGGDNFARIGVNGAGLTNLGDTRLANLDAAVSGIVAGVFGATADGVTLTRILTALLAFTNGKVTITDNGNSTSTATFLKRDGTTPAFTATYNQTTGARGTTGANP